MKSFSRNKKIVISVAVVLVIALVAVLVYPFLFKADAKNFMYGDASTAQGFDRDAFDISFGEKSEFLFNSQNSAFAIFSAGGKTVFSSHSKDAADNSLATVLDIRLRDKKGNSYSMDSATNSVAFGTFEVTDKSKASFTVIYNFYTDKKMVKTAQQDGGVYASVPVTFSLESGQLNVSVDVGAIKLPDNLFLEKISILPGLFSVKDGYKNTFFTVPDGCGAQIDTSAVTQKPVSLSLSMYGEDVSLYDYNKGAILPFFALTKSGTTVNVLIEDGDALSEVVCKKFENGGGYLYNTFTTTLCGVRNNRFVKGEEYKGVVSQTYIFNETDCDYNTIAAQVRDNLSERNYLSTSLNSNFNDFPFFINVVGSVDGKTPLTTYEDAAEITALLKSRGVRNIALRFSGYGKNGLESTASEIGMLSKSLGGRDAFVTLNDEIKEQGNEFYFDANILTGNYPTRNMVEIYNETSRLVGSLPKSFSLATVSKIKENTASTYKFVSQYETANVCLNDASSMLYTDLVENKNRQTMLDEIVGKVGALSASGSLMTAYPAAYLLKHADAVFSTPNTASCEGVSGVKAVPILQIVLHGSVVYGSMPINVSNLSFEDSLLKCVEFGCVPTFLFTHSGATSVSYSSYATQTAKLYSKAKQLMPVMGMKITSHEEVTEGVYKITYDYSKVVYVNYNPSLVEINGIMVSAKDFVVI